MPTTGTRPSARTLHTAVISGDIMIIFGGNNDRQYFNDVVKYHIGERRWEAVAAAGNLPEPRSQASAVIHTANYEMIIFGGL